MWQVITRGESIEDFQQATPSLYEVPAGSPVKLRIELDPWAPVGKLADLAGVEWWAQRLYPEMEIRDVYGNWYWIEVRGIAKGMHIVVVVAIIVAALIALGLTSWVIKDIILSADVKEREQAKMEFIEARLREGYTPEQIDRWLKGIESPPPEISLLPEWDSIKPYAIGIGVAIIIGLILFMVIRK